MLIPPFSINEYILMNGMFPDNHGNSEVAAGNATVYFIFVYFSLFLKG